MRIVPLHGSECLSAYVGEKEKNFRTSGRQWRFLRGRGSVQTVGRYPDDCADFADPGSGRCG